MFKNTLINVIQEIGNSFEENELAYLAMTCKIENPLRDKIAYNLHQRLSDQYLVCREWKNRYINNNRTDLAIIDINTQKTKYLIEFKSTSLQSFENLYSKYFANELEKMKNVSDDETEMYYVFFQHLPSIKVDVKFRQAVKYIDSLNSYFEKNPNENLKETKDKIHKDWITHFIKENIHSKDLLTILSIDAGHYYDISLTIEVFFYGPIRKS